MRIVFPLIGGRQWLGGRNWLRNLLDCLASETPGAVTALLLVEDGTDATDIEPFRVMEGVEIVPVRAAGNARLNALAALARPDPELLRLCRDLRADLLFEANGFAGRTFPVPILSWIPDFQHRHLPDYFPASVRAQRHLQMLARLSSQRHFMLSSADAEADCHHFYPASRGRTSVVRFAVKPPAPVSEVDWRETIARHDIPERYIYLPNQLWRHKNHQVVVDALARPESRDAVVVATGADSDPRNPQHGAELNAKVAGAGLGHRFRLLGMVPYRDVGVLLAGAQALVNPSRFEGWSTTVEEAKALGVPMLLSDLRVHREQAGETARYFGCDDPAGLAGALGAVVQVEAAAALARAAGVKAAQAQRLSEFATAFVDVAHTAVRTG